MKQAVHERWEIERRQRVPAYDRYAPPRIEQQLCVGDWPDFCYEVWPVSRFAWCRRCLTARP